MKSVVYLILIILCLTFVYAEIDINTTVQLDDRGNDMFFVKVDGRTVENNEGDDMEFNCTNLNESKFEFVLERDEDELGNCRNTTLDAELVLESIENMTNHCSFIEEGFNCTEDLVERIAAHERTVVRYEDCKEERTYFESMSENKTSTLDDCETVRDNTIKERNQLQTNYDACAEDLDTEQDKVSSTQMWIVIVGIIGVAAGYWYNDYSKKTKPPKPMADVGYSGLKPQPKSKW